MIGALFQDWPTTVAWLLLPTVAGLLRYCRVYGYEGVDRAVALDNAMRLAALLYGCEAAIAVLWACTHWSAL